jgi:hypothetical protein
MFSARNVDRIYQPPIWQKEKLENSKLFSYLEINILTWNKVAAWNHHSHFMLRSFWPVLSKAGMTLNIFRFHGRNFIVTRIII